MSRRTSNEANSINALTSRPANLKDIIAAAEIGDANFTEIKADTVRLRFQPSGIAYDGQEIRMSQRDRIKLFNSIHAPGNYLGKHSLSFQAEALNEHARRGDFGQSPMLVLNKGKLVTIMNSQLRSLSNAQVVKAVQEALGRDSEDLIVAKIGEDPERLDLELVSPSRVIAVSPGDVVQSGMHIAHQRHGNHATVVEAFFYRLICSNGMTRRVCVNDSQWRTRRLPLDFPNNSELQMNQIRRLARQNWDGLQAQLEALRATSERKANVEQLLTRWLERARISVRLMMPRLLAAWEQEGAEQTEYGAVNALTRLATHSRDLSERQRGMLASLAGLLSFSAVHVCERCFSVLSRSAGEPTQVPVS